VGGLATSAIKQTALHVKAAVPLCKHLVQVYGLYCLELTHSLTQCWPALILQALALKSRIAELVSQEHELRQQQHDLEQQLAAAAQAGPASAADGSSGGAEGAAALQAQLRGVQGQLKRLQAQLSKCRQEFQLYPFVFDNK